MTVAATTRAGNPDARWRSISLVGRDRAAVAFAGLVVLTVAPVVAAAVSLVGQHWHPASDLAIQLLQIDDVGSRHTPLTGVHSRYGWDHPGPLLLWLLAPFDRLFGPTGVLVGVAVLNIAALVGALVIARRRGGVTLTAVVATMLLLLTLANDTDLFVNPWNPWVAVLPFFTYVLLAWSVADGDVGTLPWLVGVGTFVVQAHVGYAPLVLGAGVFAGAMARRAGRDHGARRALVGAAIVAVALWLPPIVQQLRSADGNLAAIVEFFRHPPEARAGWRTAWGVMGTELGPPGAWLAGDERGVFGVAPSAALPAVALVVLTAALGVLAARRGAPSPARLALLIVALCGLGVVATSRITGVIGTYIVRWWWVLAAVVWLSIVWSVMCLLAPPARRAARDRRRRDDRARGDRDGSRRARRAARPRRVGSGRRVGGRSRTGAQPREVLCRRLDRGRALRRGGDGRLRRAGPARLRRRRAPGAGAGVRLVACGARRGRRRPGARHRQHRHGGRRRAPAGWVEAARFDAADGEDYAVYVDRS